MAGLNKLLLIGHLGNDPDMRFTPEGKAVTNFSLAVTDGKSGTVWFRVTSWESLAEKVNEYLTKGREVTVVGTLSGDKVEGKSGTIIVPRVYQANDGAYKAQFEVTARTVHFHGGRAARGL